MKKEKKMKIDSIRSLKDNLRPCRALKIYRPTFGYYHWVFIGNADQSGCDCYHYSGNVKPFLTFCTPGMITKSRINYSSYKESKKIKRIFTFEKGQTVVLVNRNDYPKSKDAEEICIKRAESRLGETMYSIVSNNCESYVNWIFTGENNSYEYENATLIKQMFGSTLDGVISTVIPFALADLISLCLGGIYTHFKQSAQYENTHYAFKVKIENSHFEVVCQMSKAYDEKIRKEIFSLKIFPKQFTKKLKWREKQQLSAFFQANIWSPKNILCMNVKKKNLSFTLLSAIADKIVLHANGTISKDHVCDFVLLFDSDSSQILFRVLQHQYKNEIFLSCSNEEKNILEALFETGKNILFKYPFSKKMYSVITRAILCMVSNPGGNFNDFHHNSSYSNDVLAFESITFDSEFARNISWQLLSMHAIRVQCKVVDVETKSCIAICSTDDIKHTEYERKLTIKAIYAANFFIRLIEIFRFHKSIPLSNVNLYKLISIEAYFSVVGTVCSVSFYGLLRQQQVDSSGTSNSGTPRSLCNPYVQDWAQQLDNPLHAFIAHEIESAYYADDQIPTDLIHASPHFNFAGIFLSNITRSYPRREMSITSHYHCTHQSLMPIGSHYFDTQQENISMRVETTMQYRFRRKYVPNEFSAFAGLAFIFLFIGIFRLADGICTRRRYNTDISRVWFYVCLGMFACLLFCEFIK